MSKKLTENDLARIIANPFYCIDISEQLCIPHEKMVSESDWIKAGVNTIKERGAEQFLKDLLENLKGNYV